MRYAENWTKVDIKNLNLEKVLNWCSENLKGKQFIENNTMKFSDSNEAAIFKSNYEE